MKYITLVLFVCSSVFCTPIENIENGDKRQKKSPQLNLLPFSAVSPFDPTSDLGLTEDLQFKNVHKSRVDEPQARTYYESGNSGAVGVFPSAKASGYAIPLLLSCSPSVVSGQLSSSKPLYRRNAESISFNTDKPLSQMRSNMKQLENLKLHRFADETQLRSWKKVERSVDEKQLENLKETPLEPVKNLKDTMQHIMKLRLKVKKESDN